MLVYMFRYVKMRLYLILHPNVDIPPVLNEVVHATLERTFERERMKEEWAEVRKLQEIPVA